MNKGDKVREVRFRNVAERRGLILQRCRRRDPLAIGYGTYQLVSAATGAIVAGDPAGYGLTLDDVERVLASGRSDRLSGPTPGTTGDQPEGGGAS